MSDRGRRFLFKKAGWFFCLSCYGRAVCRLLKSLFAPKLETFFSGGESLVVVPTKGVDIRSQMNGKVI